MNTFEGVPNQSTTEGMAQEQRKRFEKRLDEIKDRVLSAAVGKKDGEDVEKYDVKELELYGYAIPSIKEEEFLRDVFKGWKLSSKLPGEEDAAGTELLIKNVADKLRSYIDSKKRRETV